MSAAAGRLPDGTHLICLGPFQHFLVNTRDSGSAIDLSLQHSHGMFTAIYIEVLLVDEELAEQVWEAWDTGEISDFVAVWAWWLVSERTLIPAGLK